FVCRYIWDKDGFGDLLMMALPHHVDMMDQDTSALILKGTYQTVKGKMTGVLGSVWE
ncbi:unnamed protein product, partial [Discosporangium mesarthrocarpum]